MRRLYAVSVAAAAIVGVAIGIVLHSSLGTGRARADAPALPKLHGQATWRPGQAPAPRFRLRDQHGRLVDLARYRGRTVVLAFMDSLCTSQCPLEAAQLRAAFRPLPAAERPQLVIVSVDLADTPATVAKAARKWRLPAGFEWLLGTHAELAPVWKAYGIYVKPTKGDVIHSDALYLIDAHGDERAGFIAPFGTAFVTYDLRTLAHL